MQQNPEAIKQGDISPVTFGTPKQVPCNNTNVTMELSENAPLPMKQFLMDEQYEFTTTYTNNGSGDVSDMSIKSYKDNYYNYDARGNIDYKNYSVTCTAS